MSLLLILTLLGPDTAAAQDTSTEVTLSGKIIDNATKKGISEAKVTLLGLDQSTTTDEEGTFSFGSLKPGTYTVGIHASGYQPWSKEVVVEEEGTELEVNLTSIDEAEFLKDKPDG